MQLKLRHILLYVAACLVLAFANVGGLSLLAIASLLQISVLVQGFPFTKKAQLAELKLFFITLPSLFFWGAMHSFTYIYFRESSLPLAVIAIVVTFFISLFIGFQLIFSQEFLEQNNFEVLPALSESFNQIRNKKGRVFKIAGLIFLFSFIPYIAIEWKLVFSLTATLFYLHRLRLMKAFANRSANSEAE
jgi:hypothetical protein